MAVKIGFIVNRKNENIRRLKIFPLFTGYLDVSATGLNIIIAELVFLFPNFCWAGWVKSSVLTSYQHLIFCLFLIWIFKNDLIYYFFISIVIKFTALKKLRKNYTIIYYKIIIKTTANVSIGKSSKRIIWQTRQVEG